MVEVTRTESRCRRIGRSDIWVVVRGWEQMMRDYANNGEEGSHSMTVNLRDLRHSLIRHWTSELYLLYALSVIYVGVLDLRVNERWRSRRRN